MSIEDIYLSAKDFLVENYRGLYFERVKPGYSELTIKMDDCTVKITCLGYFGKEYVYYSQNYKDGRGYAITLGETGCLTEKGIKNVTEELIVRLKRALYFESTPIPEKDNDLALQLGEAKARIKGLEKQLDSLQENSQYSKEYKLRQDLQVCLYTDNSAKFEQTLKDAWENGVSISTDSELMTGIYRDITKFYYKHGFSWLKKYVYNPHKYIKVDAI